MELGTALLRMLEGFARATTTLRHGAYIWIARSAFVACAHPRTLDTFLFQRLNFRQSMLATVLVFRSPGTSSLTLPNVCAYRRTAEGGVENSLFWPCRSRSPSTRTALHDAIHLAYRLRDCQRHHYRSESRLDREAQQPRSVVDSCHIVNNERA